jgi:hypothetical protein
MNAKPANVIENELKEFHPVDLPLESGAPLSKPQLNGMIGAYEA